MMRFLGRATVALATVGLVTATALPHEPVSAFSTAPAQSGTNLERPPTWKARYDTGEAAERGHLVMRPGWHVNPGSAAIFWDPGRFAAGNFAVTSTIFLFPPGQGDPQSDVEAPYGLLLAGEDLDGPRPTYVTFLLRNDGRIRVARHAGTEVHDIVPWTPHEAVATWSEESEGTARNVLGVDVTDETVTFWVNDEQVAFAPRADVSMDGIVGLRAGDDLSLHITNIAIGPNRG
jgi:hypothetical protein